jgi:hypothetical protein
VRASAVLEKILRTNEIFVGQFEPTTNTTMFCLPEAIKSR